MSPTLRLLWLLVVTGSLANSGSLAHAGKLERVRDATTQKDPEAQEDENEDEEDDEGESFFALLLAGLMSIPNGEETTEDPVAPRTLYTSYPYAAGYGGNLFSPQRLVASSLVPIECPARDPGCHSVTDVETCVDGTCYRSETLPDSPAPGEPAGYASRWQLSAEYGGDFNGLRRGTLGLWTESAYRVGLESRWTYWAESLPGGGEDRLVLGDLNVVFRVLQSARVPAHLGVGGRLLADPVYGSHAGGFNGVLSLEAYPAFPLAVRFHTDLGNLGPAFFVESQASLGVLWKRAELYTGYATMLVDPVLFHGPVAGLRLHL